MKRIERLILVILILMQVMSSVPKKGTELGTETLATGEVISSDGLSSGINRSEVKVVDFGTLSENAKDEYRRYTPLGTGKTLSSGWLESFDLYYRSLDAEEKKAFNQITAQVSNSHPECVIETSLDVDAVGDVIWKWQYSSFSAEAYQIYQGYSISWDWSGRYYVEMNLDEDCDTEVFDSMLDSCVASADGQDDLYGKLHAVHSWIIDNCEYDYDMSVDNQSAGSISDGKTVCAGFARFYALACLRLEIPANVISTDGRTTGTGHSFNYVFVEGGESGFLAYLCDVTWDIDSWSDDQWEWFLIGRANRDRRDENNYHSDLDEIGLSIELQEDDYAVMFGIQTENDTGFEYQDPYSGYEPPTSCPLDDPWRDYQPIWDVSDWEITPEPDPVLTGQPVEETDFENIWITPGNEPAVTDGLYDGGNNWETGNESHTDTENDIPVIIGIPYEDPVVTDIPYSVDEEGTAPVSVSVDNYGRIPDYRYEYRFNEEGFIIWEHVKYSDGSEKTSWIDVGSTGCHYEYTFDAGGAVIQLWQTLGPYTWTETFEYDDYGNIVKHSRYSGDDVVTEVRKYSKNRQTRLIIFDSDGKKKSYKFKYKKGIAVKYPYVCGTYSENGLTCFQICVSTYDKHGVYLNSRYYIHGKKM